MPIFEFECSLCGQVSEHYVTSMKAATGLVCPGCGGAVLQRVLSLLAPPVMGGTDGKLRTAEKIRKRNDAHHNSPSGQEEHRANVAAAHKRLGLS